MKKLLWFALLLCVLALTLTSLASCGGSGNGEGAQTTEPATEAVTYEITFSVNGQETKATVAEGTVPSFEGETEWEDDSFHYSITGWDKEIVAANADTTYVATVAQGEFVDVLWATKDDVKTTRSYIGATPVPPTINDVVTTEQKIFTFTGEWNPAPQPITKNREYFEAVYTEVPHEYNVTFRVGGEVVSTSSVAWGVVPTPPEVTIPEGLTNVSWGLLSEVREDVTYDATFCTIDGTIFATAVNAINTASATDRASGALLLAMEEKSHPGNYSSYVLNYLRWVIAGGNEPTFEFSPNFNQPMISAAVAVSKATPTIWNELTAAEIDRLDLLMKCLAVQGAQATDDGCNYTSGPGFNGNYKKTWNPNYPLSNVTQMIFCTSYFGGGDATNQILKDFDYDAYVALLKEYGWSNALATWTRDPNPDGTIPYKTATEGTLKETWSGEVVTDDGKGHLTLRITTSSEDISAQEYGKLSTGFVEGEKRIINYTTPKTMMMEGGPVYAMKALYRISQYVGSACGTGLGVPAIGEKGYKYKGYGLNDLAGIWNSLVDYNYSGGNVTSGAVPDATTGEFRCYIYDHTTSPVEGYAGMMKEFNSGNRSSVGYCKHDFIMCAATSSAMTALGLYDPHAKTNLARAKKVWVGNVDFIYKAEHGYVSFSGTEVRGAPKPEYGTGASCEIWTYYWVTNEKPFFTLEEIGLPIITADPVEALNVYRAGDSGSADYTFTLGKKANEVLAKETHYWEQDFFTSFTLNYDDEMLDACEIRMRSGAYSNDSKFRGAIMKINGGNIGTVGGTTKAGYPDQVELGEYGYHRITLRLHEDATPNETTKSVDYLFTVYVYIDGVEKGAFEYGPSIFVTKGWALYGATYDETVEGHLVYSDVTPDPGVTSTAHTWNATSSKDNPYFQFYHGKVFNDTSKSWFIEIGDQVAYAGTAPEKVVPVTYHLNDGAFATHTVEGVAPYTLTYSAVDTIWFASTRTVELPAPVKEGMGFHGWFNNAELTGEALPGIVADAEATSLEVWVLWGDPIVEEETPMD